MRCNIYCRILTCSIFTLVFLIPCILFNIGIGREWNKNAVVSKCFILGYDIMESKCSYKCNCQLVCLGKPYDCHNICDLCWKTCYNGYVDVFINKIKNKVFGLTDDTITKVESQLSEKYPINSTITCYYYNNITKFSNTETDNYLGYYIFFTIIACLIAFITLSIETYIYCRRQTDIL